MPVAPMAPEAPPPLPNRLLIPFASASAPECLAVLSGLRLPNLQALLAELAPVTTDTGDDHSLSLPHERALARAQGLVKADGSACDDGQIPWAAAASANPTTPQAWFSPCHFQIGTDHVSLLPGDQIGLTDEDARGLFDAFAPYCAEDGITLRFESATRWHASGEPLRGIACASLDRVSGRPVDGWMPQSPANPAGSQLLKRLQSEAQMLFYTHPVHDARTARGLLPVNGFWVSGAGALETPTPLQPAPTVPDTLRQAALRADWAAWQQAWAQLDATAIKALLEAARRGEPVTLTLCGERGAKTWVSAPRNASARLGRLFKNLLGTPPAWKALETL
ncbi:phosphoglycerate mutase [Hydrogenophaga sp. D2P1]|uniref:Phosphoglycerate mutase n=1 Tax=Hydrogenophaga aromaticivorans TaxID=2610898 RepID=A0A7Y8GWN7_9BURK|nr:phosphoglycerate mutase [Hydrogenophaga aromaticivorans]NWF46234.1 phosphoglycerate mutase [Hydrogenophaga aromaticivorans]